eukprot:7483409-Alexandrium_andersonii.AAC.1
MNGKSGNPSSACAGSGGTHPHCATTQQYFFDFVIGARLEEMWRQDAIAAPGAGGANGLNNAALGGPSAGGARAGPTS